MSVSFDWEFSDDTDSRRKRDGSPPPSRRQRRWLLWGAGLIVALLLVILTRAWMVRRLRVAEIGEAEFRAAVELEAKAISEGDLELFHSLQDPADPNWQESQMKRYSPENQTFVPAPGLCPSDRIAEIQDLHFFGDTGRVEITRWFQKGCESSALATSWQTDTLPFHMTWFYLRDEHGDWHHIAPTNDYWGIPFSWHGNRLTVRATEVEAERIDSTARSLAGLMSQACLWMECPEEDQYTISFEDIPAPTERENAWALPALYMAGLPDSDGAQAAWQEALARWAIEKLAESQVGDEPLTRRIAFQELRSGLVARMGLAENPETSPFAIDLDLLSQALRNKTQHPVWSLWQATEVPSDPDRNRLLKAEVAALLRFLEGKVGLFRVYELLPALGQYERLSDALDNLYGLDGIQISSEWTQFLENLTGVTVNPGVFGLPTHFESGPLEPPPTPAPPSIPPGNQIAANCGGRVWVGNADGTQLTPITSEGQQFSRLHWSPDGRWLAATWRSPAPQSLAALYVLAADGTGGHLLTDDTAVQAWPLGWWLPEKNDIVALMLSDSGGNTPQFEVRAFDAETDAQRLLAGIPYPSPGRELVAYVAVSADHPAGSVSLVGSADADPLELPNAAWMWPSMAWSPDGANLTLATSGDRSEENELSIYNVASENFSSVLLADDLLAAYQVLSDTLSIQDQVRPSAFHDEIAQLSLWGWSSDGRRLVVSAHSSEVGPYGQSVVFLAIIPALAFEEPLHDLSAQDRPSFLALADAQLLGVAWSPVSPSHLVFSLVSTATGQQGPQSYLVDIDAGIVRALSEGAGSASWSPDGRWLAMGKQNRVVIADGDGLTHVDTLVGNDQCHEVIWNPIADLSDLDDSFQ